MAITYTWTIEGMSTMPTPEPDFVTMVFWTLSGTDGTHTVEIEGSSQFSEEGETFTEYANLTENQIIEWVQNQLGENGVANRKANIEGRIDHMKNPPVSPIPKELPWN